ncbi:hypothetical protein M3O96_17820 [Aquiflexum sp. TKW24L]|uniref:hypothetical protein n=1 Tax=Aquiflexum sp. TKW24L TaxID=2942212 RepID=UPI0020BE6585|nr:hypothetical protein [Aquiflexum sp. TKW24L]MCL6260967.1 hypothetical protein [Aquiflexum sp. TKW24L]
MGYLPIIITLSGFIGLFFLVVNQSMIAKKKAILQILQALFDSLGKSGSTPQNPIDLQAKTIHYIDGEYLRAKSTLNGKTQSSFEKEIRPVYQSLKVTISQYNKLIGKRPYSFVAKVMGHKPLG